MIDPGLHEGRPHFRPLPRSRRAESPRRPSAQIADKETSNRHARQSHQLGQQPGSEPQTEDQQQTDAGGAKDAEADSCQPGQRGRVGAEEPGQAKRCDDKHE